MSDERLDELLGAYAIDAVDDHERQRVEEYLASHPRALDEVRAHRNAAAVLGDSVEPPPPGVWDRIAASIDRQQQPEPGVELAKVLPLPQRSRWRSWGTLAAAAAVAAVATAAVVVVVRDDDGGGTALEDVYDEAVADPDARQVQLASEDGAIVVDAVLTRTGRGFVDASDLPALEESETYQLWAIYDGDPISLGVIGNEPGIEPFSATGDVTALAISRERAGGVVAPTEVVLSGALA